MIIREHIRKWLGVPEVEATISEVRRVASLGRKLQCEAMAEMRGELNALKDRVAVTEAKLLDLSTIQQINAKLAEMQVTAIDLPITGRDDTLVVVASRTSKGDNVKIFSFNSNVNELKEFLAHLEYKQGASRKPRFVDQPYGHNVKGFLREEF